MKRIALLTGIFVLALSSVTFAATPVPEEGSIASVQIEGEIETVVPPELGSIVGTYDRRIYLTRGCCSHHKGVCGCENGRVKCCDGRFSPSCKC